MIKKNKAKNKVDNAQNKVNKAHAKNMVKKLSDEEKKTKIAEFEKIGYEYNDGIHILLELETIIPYEFVLYCFIKESLM